MPLTFKALHVVSWEVEREEDKLPSERVVAQRLGWQETSGTTTRFTVTTGPRRQLTGKVEPLRNLYRPGPTLPCPHPCRLTLATFCSHSVPVEPLTAASFLLRA